MYKVSLLKLSPQFEGVNLHVSLEKNSYTNEFIKSEVWSYEYYKHTLKNDTVKEQTTHNQSIYNL